MADNRATRSALAGGSPSSAPSEGEVALVFAADEGFAQATAVAMHSALKHLPPSEEPETYVLDNCLTGASRDRLRDVAFHSGREIRWLEIPSDLLVSRPASPHLTPTTYARLLIPDLLPTSVRRAVYLDGDVLVREDLSPLFRVELGGAAFAAVRDFGPPRSDSESAVGEPVEPKPFFNLGVLVIDLTRWRTVGFADRALAFAQSTKAPLPYADQDAMNAVATADDWLELGFRWNVQVLLMYRPDLPRTDLTDWLYRNRSELYRSAAIIHFNGLPKPWQPWSYGTSKGKTLWAWQLIRSGWYGPMELLRWFVPWLGRRIVDAGRRGRARAPST
jgi:UDP-glucose/galactose:(glucosyl)LPS alpha-1,2-glucosyl/galactosyltransferase